MDSLTDDNKPDKLYSSIRCSFIKWQRSQVKKAFQNLKEHSDYHINIEADEKIGGYMVKVRCKCGASILLQNMNEKVMISNWTRHLQKTCSVLKSSDKNTSQTSLTSFLLKSPKPSVAINTSLDDASSSDTCLPQVFPNPPLVVPNRTGGVLFTKQIGHSTPETK